MIIIVIIILSVTKCFNKYVSYYCSFSANFSKSVTVSIAFMLHLMWDGEIKREGLSFKKKIPTPFPRISVPLPMNLEYRQTLGHCCCLIICILLLHKKLCSPTGCHCKRCCIRTEQTKFPKELQDSSDCLLKACVCCRIGKVYSTALKNTLKQADCTKQNQTQILFCLDTHLCVCRDKKNPLS